MLKNCEFFSKKQKTNQETTEEKFNEEGQPNSGDTFEEWDRNSHGLPVQDIARYSRHLLVPDFGVSCQAKLRKASVLVIGAGGLGCSVIPHLAAAGVGGITVVDNDVIEISNLHRQVLYREYMVGMAKAEQACTQAKQLNSGVETAILKERFGAQNGVQIIQGHNLVIDATDNVYSRYLINDACVLTKTPLVSGSAIGFEGQLAVYNWKGGPCYRCVFPRPDTLESHRTCTDSGVIGTVPGTIGCMQATEALKILSGFGAPLSGKLLTYDASDCSFFTMKLKPAFKQCMSCGEQPEINNLGDTVAWLMQNGLNSCAPSPLIDCPEECMISCQEYHKQVQISVENHILVDVRPSLQFAICSLPHALNIPFSELKTRVEEIRAASQSNTGKRKQVYLICRRGNDSRRAVNILFKEFYFREVFNIIGGMTAWAREVDSTFPVY